MKSIEHSNPPNEIGFGERIWSLLGFGKAKKKPDTSLDPLFQNLSESDEYVPKLKEVLLEHPGHAEISAELNKLLDPELKRDEASDIVNHLQTDYGTTGRSRSYSYSFKLPHNATLRIRIFAPVPYEKPQIKDFVLIYPPAPSQS